MNNTLISILAVIVFFIGLIALVLTSMHVVIPKKLSDQYHITTIVIALAVATLAIITTIGLLV